MELNRVFTALGGKCVERYMYSDNDIEWNVEPSYEKNCLKIFGSMEVKSKTGNNATINTYINNMINSSQNDAVYIYSNNRLEARTVVWMPEKVSTNMLKELFCDLSSKLKCFAAVIEEGDFNGE